MKTLVVSLILILLSVSSASSKQLLEKTNLTFNVLQLNNVKTYKPVSMDNSDTVYYSLWKKIIDAKVSSKVN